MNKELEHIRSHNFAARIEYELAFYFSRRQFPMFSILDNSFYYFRLRTLLEKYQTSDVSVISVSRLDSAEARRGFVEGVFETAVETAEVPFMFSSADVEFDEPKPDFNDKAFDWLRSCLSYDLAEARHLIRKTRFSDSLLDNKSLDRYLTIE
jgi:hypothetical protein